jgi:thioesterase domain-containing protein
VRIEPGEIEAALLRHPAIAQAAVIARARDSGRGSDRQLVAYMVGDPDAIPPAAQLRAFLRETLPEVMVPSAFVALDEMPLNPNGKLDRALLPEPAAPAAHGSTLTDTERRLADLWREVLDLAWTPGPEADFFDLGGQSLLAFRLFELIAEHLGCELTPSVLVEASTVRSLSARIDEGGGETAQLVKVHGDGTRTPCVYVHHIAGEMFTLRTFASTLGPEQPLYGLEAAPDWETPNEPVSVVETAAHCISILRRFQPSGPYRIIGHSWAGVVAFEMACRLQRAGEEVALLGLLDPAAPHTLTWHGRLRARAREIAGLAPDGRRAHLPRLVLSTARRRIASGLRGDQEPMDEAARLRAEGEEWLARLRSLERKYRPGRFRGEVVVYNTEESARYTGSFALGWERYIDGPVRTVRVAGDHVTMLTEANAQVIAQDMAKRMHAAPGMR